MQTWPFYVGDGASSNLNPGTYTFETTSADGSYVMLAPAPDTFAQPGDFAGTSGLTAGAALVNNGGLHPETSVTGSVTIGAQTCESSIYWATSEYFYAEGGAAFTEYSWQTPGASGTAPVTQDVLWGRVTRHTVPVPGDSIAITVGSNSTVVTTDAAGCYGFNLTPAKNMQKLTLALTDNGNTYRHGASVGNGRVSRLDFNVP